MLTRSGDIPSPRQTSIERIKDCAMKSERGALVRGTRQASDTNTFGRCCVENRRQKNSIPPRWQKLGLFSGLGEERRTPRATSRPLDHESTWYLRGRHVHSPALPDTNRVGRGLLLCRDRRPIVAWAVFDQRVDNFQRESASSAAYSSVNK